MFISIIFNTEYFDVTSRKMWYLKNLLHCKDNGWVLITHDYMRKHFEELQDSINERFFEQFEMRRFTLEEVKDVEQYFVPDEIFDKLENEFGSRTEMLLELNQNSVQELESSLRSIIAKIKHNHPNEKIEGILHCMESFETLRLLSRELECPLITYSFAAFRKPHGYRQTLYHTNLKEQYWNATECSNRYSTFLKEDNSSLPVFSNEEIIAILGKEHTLPLIKLIRSEPTYEVGICCECFSMTPPVYVNKQFYCDDDIFYECKKAYPSEKIKVRSHAAHLNDIQVDRSEVHNDPASFILSCRRLIAVHSQIILKALLWKRIAIMRKPSLAFYYLCQNDIISLKENDDIGLNYYIFGYLIPSDLMFSDEYWKWRLTNPSETEIYQKHLDFLFNALGLDKEKVLSLQGKERFKYLLEARGCDKQLVKNLLNDEVINNINWDVASSQFEVVTPTSTKSYWRIDTENEDGSLTAKLTIDTGGATSVRFYPLYDVAGFAKLNEVKVNGKKVILDQGMTKFKYMPKNKGNFELPLCENSGSHVDIECTWDYKKVNDYLNS